MDDIFALSAMNNINWRAKLGNENTTFDKECQAHGYRNEREK